ncbi:MAG: flagellar export chaperone FlgN [Phycisphaeraceae bacterium]|nr:flagellar export chaperone FlgN [Phycisphaeraceae bacterium]
MPADAPPDPATLEHEIDALLSDLHAEHERLLDAVRQHRAAISAADDKAIASALALHHTSVEKLRDLDQRRARLTGRTLGRRAPDAPPARFADVLARVSPEARERLSERAAGVRTLAATAQREQAALGHAAAALAGHMQGLMRTVTSRVSESGAYTRRGYVERAARPVGTLDLSR